MYQSIRRDLRELLVRALEAFHGSPLEQPSTAPHRVDDTHDLAVRRHDDLHELFQPGGAVSDFVDEALDAGTVSGHVGAQVRKHSLDLPEGGFGVRVDSLSTRRTMRHHATPVPNT